MGDGRYVELDRTSPTSRLKAAGLSSDNELSSFKGVRHF